MSASESDGLSFGSSDSASPRSPPPTSRCPPCPLQPATVPNCRVQQVLEHTVHRARWPRPVVDVPPHLKATALASQGPNYVVPNAREHAAVQYYSSLLCHESARCHSLHRSSHALLTGAGDSCNEPHRHAPPPRLQETGRAARPYAQGLNCAQARCEPSAHCQPKARAPQLRQPRAPFPPAASPVQRVSVARAARERASRPGRQDAPHSHWPRQTHGRRRSPPHRQPRCAATRRCAI